MGALHPGHLSLAQRALEDGCQVVATIFVNPTQFAAHEDLESYPSSLEQDLAMLRQQGIAGVWTPKVSTMYPGLDVTRVRLGSGLTQRWEANIALISLRALQRSSKATDRDPSRSRVLW